MSVLNEESNDLLSSGDANSLIVDLNDLLQRDPTLSTLSEDNLAIDTNFDFMNSMNTLGNMVGGPHVGMEIPKSTSISNLLVPNNSPATWVPNMGHNVSQVPANATVIKSEPLINGGNGSNIQVGSGLAFSNAVNMTSFHGQPTLSQLNSSQHLHDSGIKMETVDLDLDDIGHFFMKNNSPNVTLGVGPNTRTMINSSTGSSGGLVQVKQQVTGTGSAGQHTSGIITPNSFWQGADDSNSFSGTTNPWSTLSSSVPVNCAPGPAAIAAELRLAGGQVSGNTSYNISPLSDILTDLSSNSGSTPNQSLSPNLPSPQVPSQVSLYCSSSFTIDVIAKLLERLTPIWSNFGSLIILKNNFS